MTDKYGGVIDISDEAIAETPALLDLAKERAWQQAQEVGATDRFTFDSRRCDDPFYCPRYTPCFDHDDDDHEEWCFFPSFEDFRPHTHAYWTGYK